MLFHTRILLEGQTWKVAVCEYCSYSFMLCTLLELIHMIYPIHVSFDQLGARSNTHKRHL